MKIAVSGVHGCGKTTLVNWIAEEYGLKVLGEQARQLLETRYSFDEIERDIDTFKAFQSEIIKNQFHEEKILQDENYVVDRSAMDSLIYVKERLSKERSHDVGYGKWYEDQVKQMMGNYDLVFLIRYNPYFEQVPEGDQYRNGNYFYLDLLDRLLHSYYLDPPGEEFRTNVMQISTPVWKERQQIVRSSLIWMRKNSLKT